MKAYYCVGTHWDREWYEPFQEFRMWLVDTIDDVMRRLETDPVFACFHLDGQTVLLEDYLAIRPEERQRLLGHLRSRRLLAGPWYNLPDEWLISGESFIRNLMKGCRICRGLGFQPANFAYTPDQFGHIAALPMIMHGFGLQAGIVWRGTQDEDFPAQFLWEGPDGSRLPYHKLMDKGAYGPFDFLVRRPLARAGYTDAAYAAHVEPYLAEEGKRGPLPLILMLDAIDHQLASDDMSQVFTELQARYPGTEFVWGSLEDYGGELARAADTLAVRKGELVQPARDHTRHGQYLIVHTLSSRYPVKSANDRGQAQLEKWVEPYLLMQAMCSRSAPVSAYLEKAWEWLLKNHPHDSICGCSVDQVHRDMQYRFDQSRLIGDGLIRRAMNALVGASADEAHWQNLVVHQPLPFARTGIFEFAIPFPVDYGASTGCQYRDALWHGEVYNTFDLEDAQGARVPYQITRIDRGVEAKRIDGRGREYIPEAHVLSDVYLLAVDLNLPACGYTSLRIVPTPDATRSFGSLMTGPLSAGNAHLHFSLTPEGQGTLTHLPTGRVFAGLFLYEDAGDSGDGWTRGIPVTDCVYRGHGTAVSVSIAEDGPLRVVFKVERRFEVPGHLDRKTLRRDEAKATLHVTDFITLDRHAPLLRVRTVVENTVRDHRFRVLFPSGVDAAHSFADTPFALVERSVAVPEATARWRERINREKPFTSFFGVQDTVGGLAILSPHGLHEYAVLETPDRSLAVTLFRSFAKTVFQPEEVDGQLQQTLSFDYALYPFSAAFDAVAASRHVSAMQIAPRCHNVPELPGTTSLFRAERGNCVVSALKPAADIAGGVVRLWNPGSEAVVERLHFSRPVGNVERCNLDEAVLAPLETGPVRVLEVTVPARGLETIRFTFPGHT
ncbi:MAG: hypothetical protein HYV27_00840 [Candidatus Hydrogenedentes bacterium]|nr:hypothetical protein [Candidatus Hydrogenedentota bacterium]